MAWPFRAEDWGESLRAAQGEWLALAQAISRDEALEVLVPDEATAAMLAQKLSRAVLRTHLMTYGDSWVRDTGPLFVCTDAAIEARRFRFNGWGGKYCLEGDENVAEAIATWAQLPSEVFDFVLEGGAIEVDGAGHCLASAGILTPSRNPGLSRSDLEDLLRIALGIESVHWIEQALIHDHTDGHADTLARFVEPGVVLCMEARDRTDPNRDALRALLRKLDGSRNAQGERVELVVVPSPSVTDASGPMPASYCNFYLTREQVIVPAYRCRWDDEALKGIEAAFKGRTVVPLPSCAILTGGGSFHCITQQEPAGPR